MYKVICETSTEDEEHEQDDGKGVLAATMQQKPVLYGQTPLQIGFSDKGNLEFCIGFGEMYRIETTRPPVPFAE